MTVRDTYQASVITANTARIATLQLAALTAQEAINASGVNAGASPARGVADGSALDVATRNANASYAATRFKAEHDKQVAIQAAKDILRQTDTAPA